MKLTVATLVCSVSVVLITSCSGAGSGPSAEHGMKLFNDPGLAASLNASSCASCHPGGQGLEQAANNPKLDDVINRCITGPLGGKALDQGSSDFRSLKMYIESFADQ